MNTFEPTQTPDPFPLQPEPTPGVSKGCRAITFAGCGLMLLLVLFGGLALVLKADQLFSWVFTQFGEQIESRLSDDVDAATRERLRHAIDEFSTAVRQGKVTPEALTAAQQRMSEASRAPRISQEAAMRLINALEAAAGIGTPEAEPPPEPEPEPPTSSEPSSGLVV